MFAELVGINNIDTCQQRVRVTAKGKASGKQMAINIPIMLVYRWK
jgi:hypothetical protein